MLCTRRRRAGEAPLCTPLATKTSICVYAERKNGGSPEDIFGTEAPPWSTNDVRCEASCLSVTRCSLPCDGAALDWRLRVSILLAPRAQVCAAGLCTSHLC